MSAALVTYRRADSSRRQAAVHTTLDRMMKNGEHITVSAVARAAGVHRSLIYRHPELQAAVDAASTTPAPPPRPDNITDASLKATVDNERARNRRLTARVAQLERRLSEALGREAHHDNEFADVNEIPELERRIGHLEHENADLRERLRDTLLELEASHHVNHQLTRQLNSSPTA